MIDFTPSQKKTIATGVTLLALSVVLAFVILLGYALLKCFAFLSPALIPVILGLFLAMFFKPYYDWFHDRFRNSTLALCMMAASVLVPFGLICWFGGSFLLDQIVLMVKTAPTVVTRLSAWMNQTVPNAQHLVMQFGAEPGDLLVLFFTAPEKFSQQLISTLGSTYGATAMKAGFNFLGYLTNLGSALVTLLFFVFFLMRPAVTGTQCANQLPLLKDETRAFVAKQLDTFFDILVSFFQRQVVICLIEGVLYGIGFVCVGLPYGFIVGFLLGVLNLIPLFGTVTCLPIALPIAYFGDDGSLLRLIGVVAVWLTGQILDGYLITPAIQGKKTGLGFAGVIFSFFFWGVVFHSLLGLLLAIPLSAFCVVFYRAVTERYIHPVI